MRFGDAAQAMQAGIATVTQETTLVADLSVDIPVHLFIAGSTAGSVVDLIQGQVVLKRLLAGPDAAEPGRSNHEVHLL